MEFFTHVRADIEEHRLCSYSGATLAALDALHHKVDKRFTPRSTEKALEDASVEAFLAFHCSGEPVIQAPQPFLTAVSQRLARWLYVQDQGLDALEEEWALSMRDGPGSCISGARSTNAYLKTTNWMGVSSSAAATEYFALVVRHRPDLLRPLQCRYNNNEELMRHSHARLTTVPKSRTSRRVIATQPCVNMRLQMGFSQVLSRMLQKVGITLDSQQYHNRELARQGSLTGSLATIDLSMASDSISMSLLERVLPRYVLDIVKVASTNVVEWQRASYRGRVILNMGNGITFPLQTMLYLAIAFEVMRSVGEVPSVNQNLAVFGDDIILPSSCYELMCQRLHELGFKVNHDKSFTTGPFRESCGADWYAGYNIRPFMPLGGMSSTSELLTAYNLMNAWIERTGCDLPRGRAWLQDQLHCRRLIFPVPMSAPIDSGIRVRIAPDHLRVGLRSWYKFRCRIQRPADVREMYDDPYGFLIQAHLSGHLENNKVLERPHRLRASINHMICSDWSTPCASERRLYDWLLT